jgi:Fe-S-cluster-containing hydrogenase component 2
MCALTCTLVSGYSKQEPWKGTIGTTNTDTTNPDRTLFLYLQGQTQYLQPSGIYPTVLVVHMCALTCTLISEYSKQEPWKGTISTTNTIHNKPWLNFIFVSPRPNSIIATQWDSPNSNCVQVCMDLHISQWVPLMADKTLEGCSQCHLCMFVVSLHFFNMHIYECTYFAFFIHAYHWNDVTTMTMHIKIFAY